MAGKPAILLWTKLMFKSQQEAKSYAQSLTAKQLVNLLTKMDKAYYTSPNPLASDAVYDIIREVAQSKSSEPLIAEYLKKIGHKPTKNFVSLPHRMPSLDKIKPGTGEVEKFAKRAKGQFVLIDKLDGVSLLADYEDGNLPNLFTRGTDDEGQNINRLRPHLDIPESSPTDVSVRAEMLIPVETFNKKYAETYENPRNMTIGVTGRLKGDNSAAQDIHVVAYSILDSKLKPSKQLELLKKIGFKVPPYKVVDSISDEMLSKYFADRKKKSLYEIDGIVVHHDVVSTMPDSGNPKFSVAFKVNTSDEMQEAKCLGIEWEVSKTGKINPVILIEPTRIKGVTIKNVTGHNAFFITHGYPYKDRAKFNGIKKPIGKGALLRISRSGDVIPKVEEVITSAKPNMPTIDYEWDENGVAIYSIDSESKDDIRIKKLLHFFTVLDVEGIKEANIRLLYENGYTNVTAILSMTRDDFLELPRIKDTMASKLKDNISQCLNVPIARLADASGVFGEGMGERRAKLVFDAFPSIMECSQREAFDKIMTINGFSDKTAKQFATGLPIFAKFIKKIGYKIITVKKATKLNGLSVCFTGVRSKVAEEYVELNGGKVASGVAKGLTVLVAKDLQSGSSKLTKARSLGIPVMTLKEFSTKYSVPIG